MASPIIKIECSFVGRRDYTLGNIFKNNLTPTMLTVDRISLDYFQGSISANVEKGFGGEQLLSLTPDKINRCPITIEQAKRISIMAKLSCGSSQFSSCMSFHPPLEFEAGKCYRFKIINHGDHLESQCQLVDEQVSDLQRQKEPPAILIINLSQLDLGQLQCRQIKCKEQLDQFRREAKQPLSESDARQESEMTQELIQTEVEILKRYYKGF